MQRNDVTNGTVTTASRNRIAPSEASRRLGVKASDKSQRDSQGRYARAASGPVDSLG